MENGRCSHHQRWKSDHCLILRHSAHVLLLLRVVCAFRNMSDWMSENNAIKWMEMGSEGMSRSELQFARIVNIYLIPISNRNDEKNLIFARNWSVNGACWLLVHYNWNGDTKIWCVRRWDEFNKSRLGEQQYKKSRRMTTIQRFIVVVVLELPNKFRELFTHSLKAATHFEDLNYLEFRLITFEATNNRLRKDSHLEKLQLWRQTDRRRMTVKIGSHRSVACCFCTVNFGRCAWNGTSNLNLWPHDSVDRRANKHKNFFDVLQEQWVAHLNGECCTEVERFGNPNGTENESDGEKK